MKILFDHQIFTLQNYGGISRYYSELMRHLNRTPGVQAELSLKYSDNVYLKDLGLEEFQVLPLNAGLGIGGHGPIKRKAERALRAAGVLRDEAASQRRNEAASLRRVKGCRFDIFHPTYYDTYYIRHVRRPLVVTIYDLIHEFYPEHFPLADEVRLHKRQLLRRASIVITISQTTKRDLQTFYGVDPGKVAVTLLGNSLDGQAAPPEDGHSRHTPPEPPERFILYVGPRTGYKNFYFSLLALEGLLKGDKELFLVCAGGGEFNSQERRLLSTLGLREKVLHFGAGDASLRRLYSRARLFLLPSLYEGFGLPLVEAMSCGCPVLASNRGALPEIGGGAARYFDPKDAAGMAAAVKEIIGGKGLREELKSRGLVQASKYSWAETARQTLEIYRKLS